MVGWVVCIIPFSIKVGCLREVFRWFCKIASPPVSKVAVTTVWWKGFGLGEAARSTLLDTVCSGKLPLGVLHQLCFVFACRIMFNRGSWWNNTIRVQGNIALPWRLIRAVRRRQAASILPMTIKWRKLVVVLHIELNSWFPSLLLACSMHLPTGC